MGRFKAATLFSFSTPDHDDSPAADARRPVQGAERQKAFALGGHATLTLVSKKTGGRFTFKITRADGDESDRPFFVGVLTGPDNGADYSYLGCLFPRDRATGRDYPTPRFSHGRKSTIGQGAPSAVAFRWLWSRVEAGQPVEPQAEFWHEGRCCRCNRALTDPESIAAGIGPVCAGRA